MKLESKITCSNTYIYIQILYLYQEFELSELLFTPSVTTVGQESNDSRRFWQVETGIMRLWDVKGYGS